MSDRGRVAILISGRGSNMQSLVRAMRDGTIAADPVLVLSNKPRAEGLAWAEAEGIPTAVVDHRHAASREAHDAAVVDRLREVRPDLICLAGYMRLLSPAFVQAYPMRILNIHPSLLPSFPGLHAPRQAIEYGARVSGCTVHFVDEQCDHGPIVLQESVPLRDGDEEEALAARILQREHHAYPEAVRAFFAGELEIEGRRVVRTVPSAPTPGECA